MLLSTIGVAAGWSLPAIIALLVASKMVALQALWILAHRHCPGLKGSRLSADRGMLRKLVRFGSWLTVSSLMVPFLTQAERLLIPALLSIGALTFYAVPYEAVSRAAVLPVSMALTLFPAFSRFDGREETAVTDPSSDR
jgi:O-antigen/teichoic acid export membrane protein